MSNIPKSINWVLGHIPGTVLDAKCYVDNCAHANTHTHTHNEIAGWGPGALILRPPHGHVLAPIAWSQLQKRDHSLVRVRKTVLPRHGLSMARCAVLRLVQLSLLTNCWLSSMYHPSVMRSAVNFFSGGDPATRRGVKSVCLGLQWILMS